MLNWRHRTPALTVMGAPATGTSAGTATRPVSGNGDGNAVLARWLAETERARVNRASWLAWRVYDTAEYAELWYDARDAGERVRAKTLARLYANWPHPGGRYPDPREPGAFSSRAIVAAAARQLGVTIHQRGATDAPEDDGDEGSEGERTCASAQPLVALVTYPSEAQRPPLLALHEATPQIPMERIFFDMACMIGFIYRERTLLDPNAPHGVHLLPLEPGLLSLLHQFAIALLCLEPDCPSTWKCHCNVIRARYNTPPAEHEQPTDSLTLADLQRVTPRIQQG